MKQENTKEKIERCARKEFLEKGFNGASLRKIVKDAGVTTGAFYKYYPTKEALFAGLVDPCVNHVYQMMDENYQRFIRQDLSSQIDHMSENDASLTGELIDYVYANHDVFRLILTASEGTEYAYFIHNLALREEKSTLQFAGMLRKNGVDVPRLDADFVHMVSSGMVSSVFEIVMHNMDRKKAYKRVQMIEEFYTAGWEKIFGVKLQ